MKNIGIQLVRGQWVKLACEHDSSLHNRIFQVEEGNIFEPSLGLWTSVRLRGYSDFLFTHKDTLKFKPVTVIDGDGIFLLQSTIKVYGGGGAISLLCPQSECPLDGKYKATILLHEQIKQKSESI